jgi:hypothetical protein
VQAISSPHVKEKDEISRDEIEISRDEIEISRRQLHPLHAIRAAATRRAPSPLNINSEQRTRSSGVQ